MVLYPKKSDAIMKTAKKFILIFLCTILIFISLGEKAFAQDHLNKRVTLTVHDEQISNVIEKLQVLVNFNIIYYLPKPNTDTRRISFSATDETLKQLFDTHFVPIGIYYKDYSQAIILSKSPNGIPNIKIPKIIRLYMLTPKAIGES